MRVRATPVLVAVYVVVGIVVASNRNYLQNLDNLKRLVSALLAILLWPLVLLGVDVRID
jgi:hypothetical protein